MFPTRYGVPAEGKLTQRVLAGGEPPQNEAYYGVCKGDDMQALETTFYPGGAVQVDPMKPTLKAPGAKPLKLKHDDPLSNCLSMSTCAATPWQGGGVGGGE